MAQNEPTPKKTRRLLLVVVAAALLTTVPHVTAQEQEEECFGPENVRTTVTNDGILVEWDDLNNTVSFHVIRTSEGEEERFSAGTNTSYFDAEVEAGTSYTYEVEAFVDQAPSQPGGTTLVGPCGASTATAIPVFPSLLAGALATGLGVAGYLGARRR